MDSRKYCLCFLPKMGHQVIMAPLLCLLSSGSTPCMVHHFANRDWMVSLIPSCVLQMGYLIHLNVQGRLKIPLWKGHWRLRWWNDFMHILYIMTFLSRATIIILNNILSCFATEAFFDDGNTNWSVISKLYYWQTFMTVYLQTTMPTCICDMVTVMNIIRTCMLVDWFQNSAKIEQSTSYELIDIW